MNTELLNPLGLQDLKALKQLLSGKTILGIAGIIHDAVAHFENAARIIPAAHGLRQLSSQDLLQERNMGDVI